MARKNKHPEHVNMERWLISYADFMTLMFVLFIILYSFSQLDVKKFQQVSTSLRNEFGGGAGTGGNPVMEFPGQGHGSPQEKSLSEIEDEALSNIAQQVSAYAMEKGVSANIGFRTDERGLSISITGTVLFPEAGANLTPQAKDFINIVFQRLKEMPNYILIEGHTDNRPIVNNKEFPSNWELSSARSIRLIRYLIEEYKLDPARLSSAAYGEYKPIVLNDTPENMAKNRRVEIIILKSHFDNGKKNGT